MSSTIKNYPKVSVVIVNWNGGDLLQRCIAELQQQTVHPHEIIVVDNASSDGSGQAVEQAFPHIRVIHAGSNLGFAAGNNLAVRQAASDSSWIALLNPDAFPEPEWLESLLDAAVRNPEFAIFGSRLMDANSGTLLDGTGDAYHLSGLVWREAHGQALQQEHLVSKEIFSTCAAAGLYRRDVFDALGGFDEDYFCYVEDIDLGFRYQLAGYRCLYVPTSVAKHVGSALTGKRSDFSVYYGHRNLVWTFIKNMPGLLFWLCLPLHLALNLITIAYFIRQGQGQVIWRAKRDAFNGIPKAWEKRRRIQSQRRASLTHIWQLLNKKFSRG
ncbi:glycosyltransferase family 2 protein [Undibacterium rugosum]|uniref:Glycosyltransferase family 2 protein n=1 Tax=Undibacterium rugosum TaxID=2762291 RepID=A0A923I1K6_9BURK|nr:glycosyltransferase family 2 protein [Undibacterium rugosum]MBC3935986.1 glycosyltransferase family 2 protein [Undibacterium rugosum]MBR7778681.1 glycosyltransferase family 2 protein [Undibacterium rugosum]